MSRAEGVGLVVLTGGASRRMGRDKATLDTGGVPLAARPVLALRDGCDEVILAGRPVPGLDLPAVADAVAGQGPLSGVVTALAALRSARAVVVACDMPAVSPPLVSALVDALGPGIDASVCVHADGRLEPLPLVVRTSALPRLRAARDAGARSLRDGLKAMVTARLEEAAWARLDPSGASFESWNRPADVRPLPPPPASWRAGRLG